MPRHRPPLGPLTALFFISGVAGLLQEIAWLRVLGQSLGGSAESLAAVLVAFLGGLAIGAAAAGRHALPRRAPLPRYATLEGSCGLHSRSAPCSAARADRARGP